MNNCFTPYRPTYDETQIVKAGKNAQGSQRYRCQSPSCTTKTFLLDYRYQAYVPDIKKQLVEMAINGSGVRDTARVLTISKGTVIKILKKAETLVQRYPDFQPFGENDPEREVSLCRVCREADNRNIYAEM